MLNRIFKSYLNLEFSKKLAVIVTMLYISSLIFAFIMYVGKNIDVTNILEYIQYSFTIVLSGYFVKSGIENFQKIKVSDLFKDNSNSSNSQNDNDNDITGNV
jgi:hypothetical protein